MIRISLSCLLLCSIVRASILPVQRDEYPDCGKTSHDYKWDQYVCDIVNRPSHLKIASGCLPQSFTAQGETVRGAIVLYHGYTACSDSMEPMAKYLAGVGYHVYIFKNPGHGRIYNHECDHPDVDCLNGDPLDEFPIKATVYDEFVDQVTITFKEEFKRRNLDSSIHIAGVGGLSLGGPLTLRTLIKDASEGFFTRSFIMNPFFGITVPAIDRTVLDCLKDEERRAECYGTVIDQVVDSLVAQFSKTDPYKAVPVSARDVIKATMLKLVPSSAVEGGYDQLQRILRFALKEASTKPNGPVKGMLQTPFGWGPGCYEERADGRFGTCEFRVENMIAAHAFGDEAVRDSHKINPTVKTTFVLVQRDGPTRNSLAMLAARTINQGSGGDVNMCMYLMEDGIDVSANNLAGVPHSMLSHVENLRVEPFEMYWEQGLFDASANFFTNLTPVGVAKSSGRDECERVDINENELKAEMFSKVPRFGSMRLRVGLPSLFSRVRPEKASEDIAETSEVAAGPWQIEVLEENPEATTEEMSTVRVEVVDDKIALDIEEKVHNGDLRSVDNARLVSFQIDGREEVLVPSDYTAATVLGVSVLGLGLVGGAMKLVKMRNVEDDESTSRISIFKGKSTDNFEAFKVSP